MKEFRDAADKICTWLEDCFASNGSCVLAPDDVRFHFKGPYLLTKAGLRAKGARIARYMRDTFVDANGDLVGPPGWEPASQLYGMGWATLGAVMVERFDLARLLAKRLNERLDHRLGAFLVPDADAGGLVGDLQTDGGTGMGLVAAGQLDSARRLAERMAIHIRTQPEPRRLYSRFRADGTILTHLADGRPARAMDLDMDDQGSAGLAPGVVMLTWLSRATGDSVYRETASRYVEFVYGNRFNPATFSRSTKFGWAMLELYEDTGDPRLLQRAVELGRVLASRLTEGGYWDALPVRSNYPPSERINYTADCAMTVLSLAALPDA